MTRRGEVRDKPEAVDVNNRSSDAGGVSRSGLGDNHPLNDIIGTHEGPVWERILKNIQRNRKRADRENAKQIDAEEIE